MHVPDIHASEAILSAVVAGLVTLAGVQMKVILGMVRAAGRTADEPQGRLTELGERLDHAQEARFKDARRHREQITELLDRSHRVLAALGNGEEA